MTWAYRRLNYPPALSFLFSRPLFYTPVPAATLLFHPFPSSLFCQSCITASPLSSPPSQLSHCSDWDYLEMAGRLTGTSGFRLRVRLRTRK